MGTLGASIRAFRKRKNMSQLDLTLAAGWENPSSVSRIESGEIKPTRETILKLGEALDLNIDEINKILKFSNYKESIPEISEEYIKEILKKIMPNIRNINYPIAIQLYSGALIYWNELANILFLGDQISYERSQKLLKGQTLASLMLNSKYGFKNKLVNWSQLLEIIAKNIYVTFRLMDDTKKLEENLQNWMRDDLFVKKWNQINKTDTVQHIMYNLPLDIKIKDKIVEFKVTSSFLYYDNRFCIHQIVPADSSDSIEFSKNIIKALSKK